MCVIVNKPKGTTISEELFNKMWERNSDGAGFIGRIDGQEWQFEKGIMDKKEAYEKMSPFLRENAEIVLHMRIRSKGVISQEMTHPFDFSRSNKETRLLFHNGTVKFLTGANDCSDSGNLAALIRPLSRNSLERVLETLVNDSNGRFVTFVKKQDGEAEIKIYGDSESKEVDGIWFSNLKHLEEKKITTYDRQQQSYFGGQSSYSGRSFNSNVPDPLFNLKDPDVVEILNFYIKAKKAPDTQESRAQLVEHYSINFMCKDFLKGLVEKIKKGDTTDPILEYFSI